MSERCWRNRFRNSFSMGFIGSGSLERQRSGVGKVPAQRVLQWFFDRFQWCSAVVSKWCQRNGFSDGFSWSPERQHGSVRKALV